jgi:hypothetical protein
MLGSTYCRKQLFFVINFIVLLIKMADRIGFLSDANVKRRCPEEFTTKGKKTYGLFSNPNLPDRMLQRPKDPASLMEITSRVSGTTYEQQVENYIRGLRQIPNQSQEVRILIPRSDRAANTVRASRPMVQPVGTATPTTSLRDSAILPLTFTATPPTGVRAPTPRVLIPMQAIEPMRTLPPMQAIEPMRTLPPMQAEQTIEPQATPETPRVRARTSGRMSSEKRAIREALESPTTAARVLTTPANVRVLRSRAVPRTSGASSSQEIIRFEGSTSEDIDKDLIA